MTKVETHSGFLLIPKLPPYKGQLPLCSSSADENFLKSKSANTLGLSVDYEGTFLHTKERTPSCIVCTLLLLLKL